MELSREEHQSIWQNIDLPFLPAMSSHQTADVCVIGAGIAGLSVAYQLLREGRSVVVLERGGLGLGETGHTSAHLSNAFGHNYFELQKEQGKERTRLAAMSHGEAIDEIERTVKELGIECQFERTEGFLFLAEEGKPSDLEKEVKAAREAGLTDVELLERAPSKFFQTGPCVRFPRQASFHPLKYIAGLVTAVRNMGGKIFLHTEAQEVEGGEPARVTTARGFQVVCGSVVVATNSPFNDPISMHTKMAAYRTYMVGFKMPKDREDKFHYWDMNDPYHYFRMTNDAATGEPVLILGGEDHRTGQDTEGEDHFRNLENWAAEHLGIRGPADYRWSGQVLESHDGLGYIGRNPHDDENVYIVTGDTGHGLTHGTIAGTLIRDLILGRENPYEKLYDPRRSLLRSLKTYLSENTASVLPYTEWLSAGDVESIEEIPFGEGAIVREGLQKIAVYKDGNGRLHMYSAVCPHLQGIVRWNGVEKTWDCPCHGSRFDRHGSVLNGPAPCGLKEIVSGQVEDRKRASA